MRVGDASKGEIGEFAAILPIQVPRDRTIRSLSGTKNGDLLPERCVVGVAASEASAA